LSKEDPKRGGFLREAEDFVVWEWAKKHEFTIVSKDTDFEAFPRAKLC
jgi:predicted nuclease of predicted toxin-antitoxin system